MVVLKGKEMIAKTLMTAEEFAKTGPETDGFELLRGELVPMPPPGERHGRVCGKSVMLLGSHLKTLGRGELVCNDTGILTRRDPDSVRGADVAVFLQPGWQASEGYGKIAPDLVVEVRSPHEVWKDVLAKVSEYLATGVRMVWVIDPRAERVTVFTADQEPVTLAKENDLDGGDVLQGFRCKVAEFFQ
jgi:Uma2 family endonuclease